MGKYQKRMMAAFAAIAACVLTIVSVVSAVVLIRGMRANFYQDGRSQTQETTDAVNDVFRELRSAYDFLGSIPSVNEFLYQKSPDYLALSRSDLVGRKFIASQDYLDSMHMYNADTGKRISFGNAATDWNQFLTGELKAPATDGTLNLVYSHINGGTDQSISILFGIDAGESVTQSSCMVMTLSKDAMEKKALKNYNGITVLADAEGNVIFQSESDIVLQSVRDVMEQLGSVQNADKFGEKSLSMEGRRWFSTAAQSSVSGLYVVNFALEDNLNRAINVLSVQITLMLLVLMGLILWCSYALSRVFYSPIKKVIDLVAEPNGSSGEGDTEAGIASLYENVQGMLAHIDQLENTQKKIEGERTDNQIRRLLTGRMPDSDQIKRCAVLKNPSNVFMICIRLDRYGNYGPNERIAFEKTVCNMIPGIIRKNANCHATDMTAGETALMYTFADTEQNSFAELKEDMELLQHEFQENLGVSVTIGIGGAANSLEECQIYYEKARSMADYRFLYGRGQIFYPLLIEQRTEDGGGYPTELEERLLKTLRNDDRAAFDKVLSQIIEQIRTYTYPKVVAILIQLISECIKTMNYITKNEDMKYDLGIAKLVSLFHSEETIENVGIWMLGLFDEYSGVLNKIRSLKDDRYYKVVEQAKAYIDAHYMDENLSVEVIAKECGYSSYYFSRMFKRLIGINPVDYIKQVRIGQAKQYLEGRNVKVTEIARLVGYSNDSNFYATFKKMVGMTPSEYVDFVGSRTQP